MNVKENIFAEIDDAPSDTADALVVREVKLARFELTELEISLAEQMDCDISFEPRKLVHIATQATNQALTLVIESGLLLIAAHSQIIVAERSAEIKEGAGRPKNEGFRSLLDECGLPHQRAYEAMSMAL